MSNPGKRSAPDKTPGLPLKTLLSALIFGLAFGFLLQKGGVAKYHILVGQLLLQDWTVVKVMTTAILVGMLGIWALHRFKKINLHIKPTKLGSNILGGLTFGAGFALIGYCPGTGAAALGQGSWDALFGMAGLVAGSYLFAEASGVLQKTVGTWGVLGKLTLPDLLRIPRGATVAIVAGLLVAILVLLEQFFSRGS